MLLTACAWSLSGCKTPHDYKAEADKEVYNIIDKKWKEPYGIKANYKISDVPASPNDIQIEKTLPTSGVLTLPQAVALATAHNRQYLTEREILYIKALDLILAREEFEPELRGRVSAGYKRARGLDYERLETKTTFRLDRLLASGARISTNVTAAWLDILTGNFRSGLTSLLSAAITQPLLRGSNSRIVLENLTQAERDTVYQIRSFNRFRKTFVVLVITGYYQTLGLADTVKNAKENCRTLDLLYERVEKLAAVGRVPKEELERVRQEALQARNRYIQAEKGYKQMLDEFKITLSLPPSAEFQLDQAELKLLARAGLKKPDFSENEVIETAMIQRLDLANSSDAVADAERKVLVAADRFRAQLDLAAATNFTGDEIDTDFTVLRTLKGTIDVGLLLDLPLDRTIEQNAYRKALITVSQRQRDYEEAADMVALQLRQAHRELTEAAERHRIQSESLELAEKRLENTHLLLQYGRASSRRVLNAQQALFNAQNAATEAMVDYTVATLNFYRDAGVLQVRPDGMWQY